MPQEPLVAAVPSAEDGGKLSVMVPVTVTPLDAPAEPDLDENGVDLAQVRAMLDLAPADRLSRVAEFMNALVALRSPDAPSGSD